MSENLLFQEKPWLSPKLDVVFQALFGEVGNEEITKELLRVILQEEITSIDLNQNPIFRSEFKEGKRGILDIFAKINTNEYCNIEMQVAKQPDLIERLLFYWAKAYTRQIHSGQKYEMLNRSIVIVLCDFELSEIKKIEEAEVLIGKQEELKKLPYHTEWKIIETQTRRIILTDKLEFHIINLNGGIRNMKGNEEDELLDWLLFLENPKSEEVKKKAKNNVIMKQALERLEELSGDSDIQRLATLRIMEIADEEARQRYAQKEGLEEGIQRGKEITRKEIAKKMLENKIAIEVIMQVTGLSEKEIKE
ncbi:MAG: Rpn family recombination-promoting nuclease/putative transposase [Clostridia bacterium]|nr:Rpn family recombination-promoting nuclease/putative transposase [Clostridia bacterium]